MRTRSGLRRLILAAALGLTACSHTGGSSSDVKVDYASDAEQNYTLGMKELTDKNYPEAEKYFEYTSSKFPYSKFASLSELALADADFAQEKYVESAERYRNFIKLHPTHAKVDYAAFRVGASYEQQIPSDFIVLPNSAEKDQTDVKNALSTFEDFLRTYPQSSLVKDAQEHVASLKKRLAEHEMRIASFYMEHDHPLAAAGRYETVVRDYSNLGYDGEALIRLGRIYTKLGEKDRAKPFLEKLVKQFPQDKHAAEAARLLGQG